MLDLRSPTSPTRVEIGWGVLDIFFTPINNRVSFDYLILFKKSFCFLGMFLKGNIYG